MVPQQYCLRWKHHYTNVQSMFSQLLEKERFCDVTLYCSASFGSARAADGGAGESDGLRGVSLRAHRVVLAACSELLSALLGAHDSDTAAPGAEPVLVIDGAEPRHVRALLDYMYTGEMNVHHSQLASLLKTAEELRIKGLSDIRWSGKDEPPDCRGGAVTATAALPERIQHVIPTTAPAATPVVPPEPTRHAFDKYSLNGGPPPLIKLPLKNQQQQGKTSPPRKREQGTDTGDAPVWKRQRVTSRSEQTDEDEQDMKWHHGNMNISAERIPATVFGVHEDASRGSWDNSGGTDEEWGDPPHDLSSFLHTKLQVDGDNTDEEQNDNGVSECKNDIKPEVTVKPLSQLMPANHTPNKPVSAAPSTPVVVRTACGAADPRFADVIKLNEYLLHGRRPHFWEEDYVRRVMEAVRMKELEMKQAAEILGVSYGTLYGRYRDVYGCINRPYRMKDFWTEQGPAEVLMRLQRGECTLGAAAEALSVSPNHLATYLAGLQHQNSIQLDDDEFEPIPIEGEPVPDSRSKKPPPLAPAPPPAATTAAAVAAAAATASCPVRSMRRNVAAAEKAVKKILIGSLSSDNEDSIPASIIPQRAPTKSSSATASRAHSTDGATSPSSLMRSRPDLTIVASSARADS